MIFLKRISKLCLKILIKSKTQKCIQNGTLTSFRSEEDQTSVMYFCRARADEFNYTNNPTFTSGSNNVFTNPSYVTNPTTFITEVGLYDNSQDLIAVAKLSSPVEKNFSNEAVIKVNMTY